MTQSTTALTKLSNILCDAMGEQVMLFQNWIYIYIAKTIITDRIKKSKWSFALGNDIIL